MEPMRGLAKVALALAAGGLRLGAVPTLLDDFERDDPGLPSGGVLTASITTVEKTGTDDGAAGRALALAWTSPHGAWVEGAYSTPRPIPGLESGSAAGMTLDLWVPATPSVASVAIRVVDAGHEMFQWSAKVDPDPADGWRTVSIPLDFAEASSHWGGHNNGRLDFPLRLGGYAVVFQAANVPAGRVLVDNVRLIQGPQLALETDRFPSLVNATGPRTCALRVTNPLDAPAAVRLAGELTGFDSTVRPFDRSVSVPAGGAVRIPLEAPDAPLPLGYHAWQGVFTSPLGSVRRKLAFVVADPVGRDLSPDRFLFGICSHTERCVDADQEREVQAAAALGATVLRIGAAWDSVEPKPETWHWETQDRLVELAARHGIETQPILGYGPAHAVSPELRAEQAEAYKAHQPDAWKITLFGPPEEAPWRRYVAAMAARYKGKIRFYEVWNEPDLGFWRGSTEQYLHLLRTASEELRRVDPAAKLMTGGFATVLEHHGRARNPDLQERVLSEASDAFDIHAFHQHGTFEEFESAVDGELRRLRDRMRSPRPLYFNETAIWSAFIGEREQAVTLVKKMVFAMARGAMGYTWYDLRNDGGNPRDMEHGYGLLTQDFQPKMACAAYLELVRRLQGAAFRGELDMGAGCRAFAFATPRGRVLVHWKEDASAASQPVLLQCGPEPVRAVDPMGAVREVPVVEGRVLAQASGDPCYLVFPQADVPPSAGVYLIRILAPDRADAELPVKANAVLANPFGHELEVRLSWTDSSARPTFRSVVVQASGETAVPLAWPAPPPRALSYPVSLAFEVAGTPWSGSIRQILPVAKTVGSAPPDGRAPDWSLASRADTVNFCSADPALAHLVWKGPEDLSAKVWVWWRNEALWFQVDVCDDLHVQGQDAASAWRGDGVQIALHPVKTNHAWEIGAACGHEDQVLLSVWSSPEGTGADIPFTARCEPIPAGMRYAFRLPFDRFGLTDEVRAAGVRFNLLVNDNDGTQRESLIRIAPDFGERNDPRNFPTLFFRDESAIP